MAGSGGSAAGETAARSEGARRAELDRLRRPPFTPTITGLVKALQRLAEVRGLGAGALDLSGLPTCRVAALAR